MIFIEEESKFNLEIDTASLRASQLPLVTQLHLAIYTYQLLTK